MSAPDAAQYVGRFYYNLFLNQEKAPAHGILVPFGKEIDLADTLPDYDLHLEDGRSLHIQVQRTRREGPSPYTFVVKG